MPDIDPMLEDTKPEVRDNVIDMPQYPADDHDSMEYSTDSQSDQQGQEQSEEIETSTPSQQDARPAFEELQLAAQLGSNLSQGMNMLDPAEEANIRNNLQKAIAQSKSRQDQLQQGDLHLQQNQMQQEQIINQIRENHGEHLARNDHPVHPEGSSIANHDHALQPSHDQQPPHEYIPQEQYQQEHAHAPLHPPPPPQHPHQQHNLQPQAAAGQLAQHYATQASAIPDGIPPRKRSKVSRACDECRRKKVKCDASSENGDEPCSNCRRSAISCLFSRIPQKRGPSKGYIKELADRIHHIEGKLASEGGNVDGLTELLNGARRESADMFGTSGSQEEHSRKRPFSSISGGEYATSARQTTWVTEPRSIQPYQTPSAILRQQTPYAANGLAPQPLDKPDSGTPTRPASQAVEAVPLDLNQSSQTHQVDEGAFSGYLNVVHPCFPLLPASKILVEVKLAQCPRLLRDAFIEALYGTMQSFVSVPGLYTNGDVGSAMRMITEWESDPTPRTSAMNLVHLQTLILAAIETDNYGPPSLKGEHGGPSKASILGRAVGLAYTMRLHVSGLETTAADDEPPSDSNENIAIRAWWTLIMLDRWNAIATASPLFIPNDSVVILPSLNPILGENVYHLARLSNILGHFAPVSLASPKVLSPESGAAPILSSFFNLSVELFREILPQSITPSSHPILHMVYWHIRLLAYLFQTNAKSTDILWPCKETVSLLLTNTQLLSPLNHHFFCLTTLSLVELLKVENMRDEAAALLKQLLDSNLAPSTWDAVIRDHIAEHIRPSTAQAAANQSLQHLADLATATEIGPKNPEKNADAVSLRTSDDYSDVGFDPRTLTRGGYLNVLAEGLSTMR